MKPVFAVDITDNKNNDEINGAEFITQTAAQIDAERLQKSSERAQEHIDRAKLPLWARIVEYVCLGLGVVVFSGISEALGDDVTLAEAYQNAAWLFYLCGGFFVTFAALAIWSVVRKRRVLNTDEAQTALAAFERESNLIYVQMGVPDDAVCVDVLTFCYKVRDGEVRPKSVGLDSTPYTNTQMRLFVKDGSLSLASASAIYSFSLSEICEIRRVDKRISLSQWNKELPCTDKSFKEWRIFEDSNSDISVKPYYILAVKHNGEEWGIYFPCYEIYAFENACNIKATAPDGRA